MKYVFLIAAFNAIFFIVLILQKKKALHDKVLIYWLSYLGIYVASYALFSDEWFAHYPVISVAFVSLLMLQGPFLYIYISALVNENFQFKKKNLLHFLPFVFFNAYLLISSFSPESAEKISLEHHHGAVHVPFLLNLFLILTVISGPAYFLLSVRLFKKLDINIFNNYSTSETINPDWLRKLVYSFGTIWTVLMIFTTVHHVFQMFSRVFCTDGIFLSLSVFIILIGYFGLKQKEIIIQYAAVDNDNVVSKKRYSNVILKEPDAEIYLERLQKFMATERPYLDENLSLPELSAKLQIPVHQLSRLINDKLGVNFFDYVNSFRIEEVKRKMLDPGYSNLSLLGIAFDSGFNTKSAFNRVFKKMTGLTPGEYKRKQESVV